MSIGYVVCPSLTIYTALYRSPMSFSDCFTPIIHPFQYSPRLILCLSISIFLSLCRVSPTETPSANVVAADGGIEPLKKNRKTPFEALEKRISALEQREIEREKEKERSLLPQSSGTAAQAAEMQEAHQEKSE